MKRLCLIFFLLFTAALPAQENAQSKEKANELWVFAEGLFERTWYKDAIKEYDNFLKQFPKSDKVQSVRWRLYECWSKLNENDQMMAALDDFIKNEKDPIQKQKARMNLARMLFDLNKQDEALKIYESINQKNGGASLWESARYEAARIFLKKGKEGEAFLRFRQLSSLDYQGKSSVRAYAIFALATMLSEKNQSAEAIKQYNRLTVVKGTPAEIAENSWYNLGVIYFTSAKYDLGHSAFMEVVNNFPNGTYKESAINQAARCHIQQAKQLEALQVLKQNDKATGRIALERDYLKGYIHWQMKQYEEAVKLFDICINHEIDLYREEAGYNKINCLHDMGKHQAVLDEIDKYLKLYKKTIYLADLYYTAGQNAEKLKKFPIAEKHFSNSLKSYVGEWELVDSAYFALARVLNVQSKFTEEAKLWVELSKRERSEYKETALLKGSEAWFRAKNAEESLKLLKIYLKDYPKGTDIHYARNRIAEIYILNGQYKKASDFLTKVLGGEVKPDHKPALQSVLGRVYYYQKDYENAIKFLNLCLAGENISKELKSDCQVYIGFSRIASGKEAEGIKNLAAAFENRQDFSALLSFSEESAVALLLEKYNYNKVAMAVYQRLSQANDPKIKISGLLGFARLALVSEKPETGLAHLKTVLELCSEKDLLERVAALSIMGEIYLKTAKKDQALQTFDFALKMKAGDATSISRSLYGMASILKEQKAFDKARRYSNQAFILYNDAVYAPKAMFLSLQCSVLTSRKKEAEQTAGELKKKFPLYFAKIEVQDYLKEHDINTD